MPREIHPAVEDVDYLHILSTDSVEDVVTAVLHAAQLRTKGDDLAVLRSLGNSGEHAFQAVDILFGFLRKQQVIFS